MPVYRNFSDIPSFEFWVWNMRNFGDTFIRRAFIKAKSKLIASAFDQLSSVISYFFKANSFRSFLTHSLFTKASICQSKGY